MRTRQPGFTLVELILVAVLGSFVLGTVYQALIVQERSSRAGAAMIRGQDALRTSLSLLESELREISTADLAGGTDLLNMGANSISFRAQRKIGFVCSASNSDKWLIIRWLGQNTVSVSDEMLVFSDGDPDIIEDDFWLRGTVSGVSSPGSTTCPDVEEGGATQQVHVAAGLLSEITGAANLTGILQGAPVRSFDEVTYGLYDFGSRGWGLGRQENAEPVDTLIGHLAAPEDGGLVFSYYDASGAVTADPGAVVRIEIRARTRASTTANVASDSLRTTLSLRNN